MDEEPKTVTVPEYHQSDLKKYLICPKQYRLGLDNEANITAATKKAMRDGELFEGYCLGFKPDKDELKIIGRKQPETVEKIKSHAVQIQPLFKKGKSYVSLKHPHKDFILAGEADNIGTLDWDFIRSYTGEKILKKHIPKGKTINDIKYTGSIDKGMFHNPALACKGNHCGFSQPVRGNILFLPLIQ